MKINFLFLFVLFVVCRDKRNDCLTLSRFGWCEKKVADMTRVCGATCNFCNNNRHTTVHTTKMTVTGNLLRLDARHFFNDTFLTFN